MRDDEDIVLAPMVHPAGSVARTADGTKVSMKNACFSCGYSLYWCKCEQPFAIASTKYEAVFISTN